MKKLRHLAAFTLLEVLIGTGVTSVVGGVIYVVASEGVSSFARNAALNRTQSDARQALDRLSADINTAGQNPTLVDALGATATTTTNPPQAQGVRFYRSAPLPSYQIPSGNTSTKTLVINFTPYQKANSSVSSMVAVGDLATIPLIGFQDTVTSITGVTTSADGSGSMTLNFANTIADGCSPSLPVDSKGSVIQTDFTPVNGSYSGTVAVAPVYYTCMVFRQVAYIAVPNANGVGAQLRYYSQAMSAGVTSAGASTATGVRACGGLTAFNNATAFNSAANYSVLANIYGGNNGSILMPNGLTVNTLLPFQLLNGSTVSTTLCEEGPDYNNRTSSFGSRVTTASNFCLLRSTTASRCSQLLH